MQFSTFLVYLHPNYEGTKKPNLIKFIRSENSAIAAVFNFFWSIYKGYWEITLILFTSLLALEYFFPVTGSNFFGFTIMLIFYLFTTELQEILFSSRGYYFHDIICAYSEDEAMMKFIKKNEVKGISLEEKV